MPMTRSVITLFLLFVLSVVVEASRLKAATGVHARRVHTRGGAAKSAAKLLAAMKEPDDDSDDDNSTDDSSDDDDEKTPVATNPAIDEAKDALHTVEWKANTNKAKLDDVKDEKAFKKEVAREERIVENETQSAGLADFLGAIREELHTYNAPGYTAHLEEQQKKLEKEQKYLEGKLASLQNESAPKVSTKASVEAPTPTSADTAKKEADNEHEIEELKEKLEGATTEAGHMFAFGFMGTVTMLTVVFGMANTSNDTVKNYTWFLMDQVVAVFLAVMYFQAFDDLLDFVDFGGTHLVLAAVFHAVFMLTLALVLAYMLRGQEVGLAILCGAGAHVTSFTSIHAAAVVQNNVWLKVDFAWVWCLVGLVFLALFFVGVGVTVLKLKQRAGVASDDGFMDKTDDMENDFGAMAFSVCWTMFIRFLITGHHPVDDDTEFDHTASDRQWMFCYGFVAVAMAVAAVPICSREYKSYFVNRATNFLSSVCAMNVAWAFFYWAEWELFETVFVNQPIFGRIAFALLCTTIGSCGIIALAKIPSGAPRVKKVALTALALMVAWSWELCFDAAIDDMAEGRGHPVKYKMAATVFMFVVVIPVYGIYMKPISMPAAEAIGA